MIKVGAVIAAITWAYNSSACLATGGYTPYQLLHGKDPTLLQDLDMIESLRTENKDSVSDYYRKTASRMTDMYKIVRAQQQSISNRNRERRVAENTTIINGKAKQSIQFKKNDLVLLWEPAQSHKIRLDDNTTRVKHGTPRKFISKWSGPHRVVDVTTAGKRGGNRYHIDHLKRGILEFHPNRLHLFNPWSAEQPSTAPEEADDRIYQQGNYAQPGSLFLIALDRPWPFGIAKVLRTDENGRVYFQWLGNSAYKANGRFELGWKMKCTTIYYQDKPRRSVHVPYCEASLLVHQKDILCHSFTLTKDKKLPKAILDFAAEHENIWWTQ